nr:hypothetical protein Iba_scaffold454758CG0010 [Ipomoea batatas]
MLVRRHSGSATLRQTAAGVSRIGRLSGRKRLLLAFSKWAGSPVEGDSGYSSRSVSDGVVWVYNPRRRQRGSDLRGFAASLKGSRRFSASDSLITGEFGSSSISSSSSSDTSSSSPLIHASAHLPFLYKMVCFQDYFLRLHCLFPLPPFQLKQEVENKKMMTPK